MSRLFFFIIFTSGIGDLAWWIWADKRLRKLPRAVYWRSAAAGFFVLELFCFFFVLFC